MTLLNDHLASPHARKQLAERIKADIDAYCVKAYDDGHRTHLGASLIGHDCGRYLWYVFRWAKREEFNGRMLRLFNRGHREEDRFVEWLKGIGFEIWTVDEGTGKQFRVGAVHGHFGGSLDGINKAPPAYPINEPMLCEFKTSGTGSKFTELSDKGVQFAKPQHYNQMSTYGAFYKLRYALYMCINKNDDDLYIEIVELDWTLAAANVRKAENVITSKGPPPRVAESEAFHTCKYCNFVGICHRKQAVDKNCRSCQHAEAIAEGQWHCHRWGNTIPKDYIPQGCNEHAPIQ